MKENKPKITLGYIEGEIVSLLLNFTNPSQRKGRKNSLMP